MIKLLYNPLIILMISALGIVFFLSLNKSGQKTQRSTENIRVLEHEVNQISTDVMNLEENIVKTGSITFKEKIIRDELLLQKEGEYIIQLPDLENKLEINEIIKEEEKPFEQWIRLLTH